MASHIFPGKYTQLYHALKQRCSQPHLFVVSAQSQQAQQLQPVDILTRTVQRSIPGAGRNKWCEMGLEACAHAYGIFYMRSYTMSPFDHVDICVGMQKAVCILSSLVNIRIYVYIHIYIDARVSIKIATPRRISEIYLYRYIMCVCVCVQFICLGIDIYPSQLDYKRAWMRRRSSYGVYI